MDKNKTLAEQGYMISVLDSRPDRIFIGRRSEYEKKTDEWILSEAFVITGYRVNGVIGLASDGPGNGTLHGNGDVRVRVPALQLSHSIELSEKWRNYYDQLSRRYRR